MSGTGINTIRIQHVTVFEYAHPIQRATMLLRLEPRSDSHQTVLGFDYEIEPHAKPVPAFDPFGNVCHLLNFQSIDRSTLTVRSNSEVQTRKTASVPEILERSSWDRSNSSADLISHWEYLAPSNRVYDCPQLQNFLTEHRLGPGGNPFVALVDASRAIFRNLRYAPGTTEVNSRIEDCLEQESGVCQDYTHILLAIGRIWGVPSRYVSGYFHMFAEDEQTITDDASHAWSEFYFPDLGWIGIDATNDMLVDHQYVRVSVGRDYDDVAPTKGVVFGGGDSRMNVNITLTQTPAGVSQAQLPGADQ